LADQLDVDQLRQGILIGYRVLHFPKTG